MSLGRLAVGVLGRRPRVLAFAAPSRIAHLAVSQEDICLFRVNRGRRHTHRRIQIVKNIHANVPNPITLEPRRPSEPPPPPCGRLKYTEFMSTHVLFTHFHPDRGRQGRPQQRRSRPRGSAAAAALAATLAAAAASFRVTVFNSTTRPPQRSARV